MQSIVNCYIEEGIATITMDDGKSNVVSPLMLKQLNDALDAAEKANAVVVLTGRENIFCAGFDLKILRTGVIDAFNMLIGGFELSKRLLAFPTPVVIACNGHAMAMGTFLLLSGDYRIGVTENMKIVANEVAIGITLPYSGIEICRQRLKPAHFDRVTLLSENYTPQSAIDAGFLDKVVSKERLMLEANDYAKSLLSLNLAAHKHSKLRVRKKTLTAMRRAIRADKVDFVFKGIKRIFKIG